MIELEKPLKKKDQVALDEEMARNLEAQMQAKLIEEERLKRQKEEEANIALIEEMKRVNTFVNIDSKVVKGSEAGIEESSKREGDKLESDMSKKQKVDEHVETEEHTDQEDEELKKHLEIVKDDEVAIEEIPLPTKPLMIIEYKIVRKGMMGHFQLIRADGSTKRYTSMIRLLQNIDREDLETLWKLVKAKHRNTRP
ncbi:hypothetical protein Tco_1227581 [Tanacetum coccineum]